MTKSKEAFHQYLLPEECTIYEVSDLKDAILPLINANKNIEFNLSQVSMIDASVVQLLISVKKELELKNLIFKLSDLSEYALEFINNIYCSEQLLQVDEEIKSD